MGFLKRLFSIGNKNQKNSKKSPTKSKSLSPEVEEEDHEVIAGRLLRSSSTRFGVVAEVDYSTLPPLPHPINNVIRTRGSSSGSAVSTSSHGTYTVTVHGRQQQSKTSLDRTNTHESDSSHSKNGRQRVTRSGSTLRQLLGHPPSGDATGPEGDISWAERVIGECETTDRSLSMPSAHIPYNPGDILKSAVNGSFSTFQPGISSMEVELSLASDSPRSNRHVNPGSSDDHLIAPRPAAEIFDFLTERRRGPGAPGFNRRHSACLENGLKTFTTSSSAIPPHDIPKALSNYNHRRTRSSVVTPSQIPIRTYSRSRPTDAVDETFLTQMYEERAQIPTQDTKSRTSDPGIAIASTTLHQPTNDATPGGRIPHGPRSRVKMSAQRVRPTVVGQTRTPAKQRTPIKQRSPTKKTRGMSGDSLSSCTVRHRAQCRSPKKRHSNKKDKENQTVNEMDPETQKAFQPQHEILSTPPTPDINSHNGAKTSYTRASVGPDTFKPLGTNAHNLTTSPASSSELSPQTQQMMSNLRQQRRVRGASDRALSNIVWDENARASSRI